ncbi:MAG: SGNH/GDSL hydrolase family protein [Deltaproteobacteria bacterium]|nr:SGNH/GDSL hydrolase family protein [Deltaproteobacteria bacterium]
MPAEIKCKKHFSNVRQQLAKGNSVRIVGLGDSLTCGWEATSSFFDLFISGIRQAFQNATVTAVNAGVCGDTASGGARRTDALLGYPTVLLTVQFGINDFYAGVSVEKYQASLRTIVQKAIRCNTLPLLITSGPLLANDQQKGIAPYYRAIHKVANETNCPVADIADHMKNGQLDLHQLYYPDGVHPNDNGYRAMANALLEICSALD